MTGSGREYPMRPLVGIATLLFRGDAVLLIRRARPPLAGALSFPGGAQKLGETAEDAARRELREETGLVAGALRLVAHADVIDRDRDARVRFHYTILHFAGDAIDGSEPRAAGDVSQALFVRLAALEGAGLDETHRAIVALAVGDGVRSGAWCQDPPPTIRDPRDDRPLAGPGQSPGLPPAGNATGRID